MTSTNDGKDVKSNQTSGQKGKKFYLELYHSLEARLGGEEELRERTRHLCEAWRRIYSICRHASPQSHAHLFSWLERHTARTLLQTEWQSPTSKDEHTIFREAVDYLIREIQNSADDRDGQSLPWEILLQQRAEWYRSVISNTWGHPVLRALLDPKGQPPGDEEILEWLKKEREPMFTGRLRQLVASKCDDLATSLATAVMDRARASRVIVPDANQLDDVKEESQAGDKEPTFESILSSEAGFTGEAWAFLTDIEFVLLHKGDRSSRCIELAKQTPLRQGHVLIERLRKRGENARSSREKKLWKNVNEVATLIAQVVIARCMVVSECAGGVRAALVYCASALAALAPPPALRRATAALAAPAASAAHLYWLARAVHAQRNTEDMKPFVCELYVRAITSGMNELERLKLNNEKQKEARSTEATLATWFIELGSLFHSSARFNCECILTAFSVHPSPDMYNRIKAAPILPPITVDVPEPTSGATTSEFGSWANDSRSQTNFVKTSETLNMKQTQQKANVLSTAILTEGEGLGLSMELCQDIVVLLSGPRVKTLSWDMDRELLLENCRTYMERTDGGTRALITELKYLNLKPSDYEHLPEEEDDENDLYYGIEKGYEHLVEFQEPQPEAIWDDNIWNSDCTLTAYSSSESTYTTTSRRKKNKHISYSSEEDIDPLSSTAETKRIEKKKERPHSKERSKEQKRKSKKERSQGKEKKERKERKKKEKIDQQSHSTAGTLSSLVGLKVTRAVKTEQKEEKKEKDDNTKMNNVCVTDSDYDSQGKSSLASLNSEGVDPYVVYDGQFDMDELKSPERLSPEAASKTNIRKINEVKVSNGEIAKNIIVSPQKPNNNTAVFNSPQINTNINLTKFPTTMPVAGIAISSDSTSSIKIDVKERISKLMQFRRQKSSTNKSAMTPSVSGLPIQPNDYYKLTAAKQECSKLKTDKMADLVGSKVMKVSEVSKVYVNKKPTEQLSFLKNNENNIPTIDTTKPTSLYTLNKPAKQAFNNKASVNETCSRVQPINFNYNKKTVPSLPYQQPSVIPQYLPQAVNAVNASSSQIGHAPPSMDVTKPKVSHFDPHQKIFQDFLQDLQGSINAGFNTPREVQPVNLKKEMKPISRVTPVVPNITKAESSPQCAKPLVLQKKAENAPNTFARLSYMHKNKQVDTKTKTVVDKNNSNIALQNSISAELDRRIADLRLSKMIQQHSKNNLIISKVENSQAAKSKENPRVEVQKIEELKSVNTASEYPVLTNMLQVKGNSILKTSNPGYKCDLNNIKPESRLASTPISPHTTSLKEKDQQDLLLLLRQQSKLNAQNSFARPVSNTNNFFNNLQRSNTSISYINPSNKYTNAPTPNAPAINRTVPLPTQSPTIIQYGNTEIKAPMHPNKNTIMSTFSNKDNSDSNLDTKMMLVKLKDNNLTKNCQNTDNIEMNKTQEAMPPCGKEVFKIGAKKTTPKATYADKTNNNTAKQEWTAVMDAILAQKTPSRGPNALDMVLNKNSYQNTVYESLRNQRIQKDNKSEDSSKVVKSIPISNQYGISSILKATSNPAVNTRTIPVKASQTDTPKKKSQIVVPKKVSQQVPKKFGSELPKDNPLISRIHNSDYDLLDDLMDDDLRQEIGELSSDEERFDAGLGLKIEKTDCNLKIGNVLNKSIGSVMNKEKMQVVDTYNLSKIAKKSKERTFNSSDSIQAIATNVKPPPVDVSKPLAVVSSDKKTPIIFRDVEPTKSSNVIRQNTLAPTQREKTILNVNNNNIISTHAQQQPNIDNSNVIIATVQPPPIQKMVVIRSDVVYDPFPALRIQETPIHTGLCSVTQNTYVINSTPSLNLFQTTQYSPVVNPIVIGNSGSIPITTPKTSAPSVTIPLNATQTIISSQQPVVEAKNVVSINQPQMNQPQVLIKPSIVNSKNIKSTSTIYKNTKPMVPIDLKKVHEEIKLNTLPPLAVEHNLKPESKDANMKNSERKVLSQVQEKQKVDVLETVDSKNQRLPLDYEIRKNHKDQERLLKKRLSIINRVINHRCFYPPIPLSYSPLAVTRAPTNLNTQTRSSFRDNAVNLSTNISHQEVKSDLKSEMINVKTIGTLINQQHCEEVKNTTTLDKDGILTPTQGVNESCKENKDSVKSCRRILLRSSNKLKVRVAPQKCKKVKARKTKVRLKPSMPGVIDAQTVIKEGKESEIQINKSDTLLDQSYANVKRDDVILPIRTSKRIRNRNILKSKEVEKQTNNVSKSFSETFDHLKVNTNMNINTSEEQNSDSVFPDDFDIEDALVGSKIPKLASVVDTFVDEVAEENILHRISEVTDSKIIKGTLDCLCDSGTIVPLNESLETVKNVDSEMTDVTKGTDKYQNDQNEVHDSIERLESDDCEIKINANDIPSNKCVSVMTDNIVCDAADNSTDDKINLCSSKISEIKTNILEKDKNMTEIVYERINMGDDIVDKKMVEGEKGKSDETPDSKKVDNDIKENSQNIKTSVKNSTRSKLLQTSDKLDVKSSTSMDIHNGQTQINPIDVYDDETQTNTIGVHVLDDQTEINAIGVHDNETQINPINVHKDQTQINPIDVHDDQTQIDPIDVHDDQTQINPIDVRDDETQINPINVHEDQTQINPIGVHDDQTQINQCSNNKDASDINIISNKSRDGIISDIVDKPVKQILQIPNHTLTNIENANCNAKKHHQSNNGALISQVTIPVPVDKLDLKSKDKSQEIQNREPARSQGSSRIQDIPESYKKKISIEELPLNDPNDPLKRCVRIKLPCGRVFKATVFGEVPVSFDSLFDHPGLKDILLSGFNEKKRYTLSIQQFSTPLNKVIDTRIKEIYSIPHPKPIKNVETVNLISDDEEEDRPKKFTTEFGKYAVVSVDENMFTKHQNKFSQKCSVKLKRHSQEEISYLLGKPYLDATYKMPLLREQTQEHLYNNSYREYSNQDENKNEPSSEVIEIDDSSNDSITCSNNVNNNVAIQEPEAKINELKNLLLKDLDILVKHSTTDIEQKDSTVNPCVMVHHKSSSEKNQDADPKANSRYLDIIKRKCVVKLVNCDDIWIKMNANKGVSDSVSNTKSNLTDKERENKLTRSESFSILNHLNEFDNTDSVLNTELCDRSSPTIDIEETIAALSNSHTNHELVVNNVQRNQFDSVKTMAVICNSEWFETKSRLRFQNVINQPNNIAKILQGSSFNDRKPDVATDYESDTDVTVCSLHSLDDVNLVKSSNVPSLLKITLQYIEDRTPLKCFKSLNINRSLSPVLKRKITDTNTVVANKLTKIESKSFLTDDATVFNIHEISAIATKDSNSLSSSLEICKVLQPEINELLFKNDIKSSKNEDKIEFESKKTDELTLSSIVSKYIINLITKNKKFPHTVTTEVEEKLESDLPLQSIKLEYEDILVGDDNVENKLCFNEITEDLSRTTNADDPSGNNNQDNTLRKSNNACQDNEVQIIEENDRGYQLNMKSTEFKNFYVNQGTQLSTSSGQFDKENNLEESDGFLEEWNVDNAVVTTEVDQIKEFRSTRIMESDCVSNNLDVIYNNANALKQVNDCDDTVAKLFEHHKIIKGSDYSSTNNTSNSLVSTINISQAVGLKLVEVDDIEEVKINNEEKPVIDNLSKTQSNIIEHKSEEHKEPSIIKATKEDVEYLESSRIAADNYFLDNKDVIKAETKNMGSITTREVLNNNISNIAARQIVAVTKNVLIAKENESTVKPVETKKAHSSEILNESIYSKIVTVEHDNSEAVNSNHGIASETGIDDNNMLSKNMTLVYKHNSGVVLKGMEYENPIVGTCYVFPVAKSSDSSGKNDIFSSSSESMDAIRKFDDQHKESYEEIDLKVIVPNFTYSKGNLKRKTDMTDADISGKRLRRISRSKSDIVDSKTKEKRYRKGKNIDTPKYTMATISESLYAKEYNRLLDYCRSVKFSYSIPFHINHIEVTDIIKNWPIDGNCNEEPQDETGCDNNFFIDSAPIEKPIFDPMMQSLSDEINTEYKEIENISNDIEETNFNMGFGEGSGRVIQNLGDGTISKFSAATLSDVKQSQPFLLSEDYEHLENYCVPLKKEEPLEIIKRYIGYIKLRDKVRSFFKKTSAELSQDWIKEHKKDNIHSESPKFPFDFYISNNFEPLPVETIVQVVQVGQLPVSAAAQNPVTCDPRVTQVSDVSPSQCSVENSPRDDSQQGNKTEYTELTTADLSLPIVQNYAHHNQTMSMESQEASTVSMASENIPIETELIKSEVKIELIEETPEEKEDQNKLDENNGAQSLNKKHGNNVDYSFETNNTNTSIDSDSNVQILFTSSDKQNISEVYSQQKQNGSSEKTDQIAHAMNAAGITTTAETITNTRGHALVNILSQKLIRQGTVNAQQNSANYPKASSINATSLQQALAQILPPPLNQTNTTENNHQGQQNPSVTPQVLHIVQGKNTSGNQITLVDNSQQSVISTPNATPVLHIVQNKGGSAVPTTNGAPTQQQNTFSGFSLVDAGLQQGGNQLLHIVNTGNQKNSNPGQLLKRVNLLTNLTNVQGGNEQKMVQFVCKSADGKSIQLNAPHQRSMVLRLQPIETPNISATQHQATSKAIENQDLSSSQNSTNTVSNKDSVATQQEIKSRSVYEENYAKFIQNSSGKPSVLEKSTSLPKFNQAFGKPVFQDGNQKQNEINSNNSHLSAVNNGNENKECQPSDNSINLEHIGQISSPPLLLRKSPAQTSQTQPNLVQQIKQTITPMNIQTMHGGVIYTRQIPVNIGGGQTINLITVPSTELIDESGQKQQSDVKFVNQTEIEPSIIKIVPQSQSAPSTETPQDETNNHININNENAQNPQPQPVLTQMRIKLPMLSKTPQMVSGARVVRPSFFQIQRNVIGGANQPVYQQLVLTAAPPLGQQTIRLPQAQTARSVKVPTESQSSNESQMSSSTLEQLREFDMVLEQVKERSTVQPNSNTTFKIHTPSNDTTDSSVSASSTPTETTQQVLYSIGSNQPLNVAYVNRKATVTTPTTSTFVRSPDSSGIADSPTSSTHVQISHTVTAESSPSETPVQQKPAKVGSKSKSRPKSSSNPPNSMKINTVPPKTSAQKPLEDEQTTQRILYILAEYKEQVENSPDKDKPAPRRRSNPPSNPSGSSKRKKSSSSSRRPGVRDISPVHGEDTCRTMGSEDSSCGTSQGDCTESCLETHSPQDSPRKVVRKLTFEQDVTANQTRPQPQRNVIVADGQTIAVARGTAGKPATAVLMPANYILPVSMVKGGQQIAIVTNRGPKLLTVGGGEGGATNALLLQRLIGPAGLKPVLARPGVRHVRLPTAALHNLQAFNLATASTVQPPDSTASPAPEPTPPELVETRAASSPWGERESENERMKPDGRGSSPEGSEPWNLPTPTDPHEYSYEETVRADNMDRTVLVVQKKDGSTQRQHRLTHVSAAALRHKYAILEHELRLQKSLSEECEDLGVDSPSASELFPEAELLFAASPAHDHAQDQPHHSHTPQPTLLNQSGIQPDIDDQIATDQLLPREEMPDERQDLDVNLGLEDVGIVTVSEDGMQATIALDQEEFARAHPNTTFHSEPTEDGEVQPFTLSGLKGRHITSTIFHSNRAPATVLMTAPQATVISQATAEGSHPNQVKYSDIDNMIHSIPSSHENNMHLSSVLVKDDGLTRFDSILTDSRELHLSNTASAIVHSAGNATQVIRRVCYEDEKRDRDSRFLMDESDTLIAGDDAKMIAEDSSRDATLESMAGDVDDDNSSPERHAELFWESNSASERSESRRPLDFSSDSDKCCKSPSFDETNSTDSSGVGTHLRLDSVIKDARGIERSGSADGSSADDTHPPLRTYPPKRMYHPLEGEVERSLSGKTRAGERSPDSLEVRRRASGRGVVKRGCHCCNGSPAPSRPKKPRQRKPAMDFTTNN